MHTGCDEGLLRVFEKSDDRGELYKSNTVFRIADSQRRILALGISPSEDNLICTTANNQMFVLGLSNTDIMKVEDMKFEYLLTPFHGPVQCGVLMSMYHPIQK